MRIHIRILVLILLSLSLRMAYVHAGAWPSLFRGVVVAENDVGVRVVSVELQSQAYAAGLRVYDIIISIDRQQVHTLEAFAAWSQQAKGSKSDATLVIFRQGQPHELQVHVYSYPVLEHWGIEFIPDYDLHFADLQAAAQYWVRQGRGHQHARHGVEALRAYLNSLHYVPDDGPVALKVAMLFIALAHEHFAAQRVPEGLAALGQGFLMLNRLFDYELAPPELEQIRDVLQQALAGIRGLKKPR